MISLIAAFAFDPDGRPVIGKDGRIPWRLPEDMHWFRAHTMYKTIVMGRKTYEGLPGGTLKNRRICVLTSDPTYEIKASPEYAFVAHDTLALVNEYAFSDKQLIVCGGQSVYQYFLPWASSVLLTEIHQTHTGDAFLPFTPTALTQNHGFMLVMLDTNKRQFRDEVPEMEWTYKLFTRKVDEDAACK